MHSFKNNLSPPFMSAIDLVTFSGICSSDYMTPFGMNQYSAPIHASMCE